MKLETKATLKGEKFSKGHIKFQKLTGACDDSFFFVHWVHPVWDLWHGSREEETQEKISFGMNPLWRQNWPSFKLRLHSLAGVASISSWLSVLMYFPTAYYEFYIILVLFIFIVLSSDRPSCLHLPHYHIDGVASTFTIENLLSYCCFQLKNLFRFLNSTEHSSYIYIFLHIKLLGW